MNVLVINLGLKSIRAIVFAPGGRQLFSASQPVHTSIIGDNAEQDPAEWVVLMHKCIEAVRQGSTLVRTIRYVTVTTSSSCPVGLDDKYQPVTPVYIVSDSRAKAEAIMIAKAGNGDGKFAGLANIQASSPVAKFFWLVRNEQDTAKRVRYWVNAGDFLAWHLTGELITDPLNAGKCLHRDGGYAGDLLGLAGLKPAQLPGVAPVGTIVPMGREFLSRYGMPDETVFVVTSYDAICAVLGGTDGENGSACDVSGTVTSIRMLVPNAHSVRAPVMCQSIGVEGFHVVGCSNNLGGGIVEWYKPFIRADAVNDVYAQMDAEGGSSPVGARGVIFLPYLMGERAPFYLPEARGTFFGLGRESGPADLTRAVLESTAYVARDLVEVLRGQAVPVTSLTVSGGLARIDLVNQIKADVTGIPVRVPENFESTAMGAFLLTAVAARIYSGMQAASRVVKFRQIIQPNFDNHAIYTKSFELFRQINQALMPSYTLHAELRRLGAGFSKATLSNL